MRWMEVSWWDKLHDRVWEVKWESGNFSISLYSRSEWLHRLHFRLFDSKIKFDNDSRTSFLCFRVTKWTLKFAGVYVPNELRWQWIWWTMIEVFLRIQELLDMEEYETYKINKPQIARTLCNFWFSPKNDWKLVEVIWKTNTWKPIVKLINWSWWLYTWPLWREFIVLAEDYQNCDPSDSLQITIWTNYILSDLQLFQLSRLQISTQNKITLYKTRLFKALY